LVVAVIAGLCWRSGTVQNVAVVTAATVVALVSPHKAAFSRLADNVIVPTKRPGENVTLLVDGKTHPFGNVWQNERRRDEAGDEEARQARKRHDAAQYAILDDTAG
jgi:hypothetical protein